jgi:YD repeat-containing protein
VAFDPLDLSGLLGSPPSKSSASGQTPLCPIGVTNTSPPVISDPNGSPTYDYDVLSTTQGTWSSCGYPIDPNGYSYYWLRNGSVVASGSTSYRVQAADIGQAVQSEVVACDTHGDCDSAVSNSIVPQDRAPYTPSSLSPADMSGAPSGSVTLSAVFNDPDYGQVGRIDYWVYRNSDGSLMANGSGPWVSEGSASAWTTPTLGSGLYCWSAEAEDATGGTASEVGSTCFDVPPPAPSLQSPISSLSPPLSTVTPVLNGTTSDSEPLYYDFQVAGDSGFANVVADSSWQPTTTTWTVPAGTLQDGGTYYWRSVAMDGYGFESGWSSTNTFKVSLPKLGAAGYWPMWSHGPLAVNEANGNLVLSAPGPSYPSTAGSMGASLTYNAQASTDNGLGAGWALNAGDQGSSPPTKLVDHNASGASPKLDAVERLSADGSSDYYTHVGTSNTYLPSAGDGSQLTKNADNTWTLSDPDGAIYTFNPETSDGTATLKSAQWIDAAPGKGALTYTFSTLDPAKITSISDDGGRTLNFGWSNVPDTNGCSGAILCVSESDGAFPTVAASGGRGGGAAGSCTGGAGARGGSASSGSNISVSYGGGNGGTGLVYCANGAVNGGAGGSSAGNAANGNNGQDGCYFTCTASGGAAPIGGGVGGDAYWSSNGPIGNAGGSPGGGGGAAGATQCCTYYGAGNGADGEVLITPSSGSAATYASAGTYTYTVPSGATTLTVQLWGGGGGGGRGYTNGGTYNGNYGEAGGGGGGGGAYVKTTAIPVTSGETLSVTVGAGGTSGANGGCGYTGSGGCAGTAYGPASPGSSGGASSVEEANPIWKYVGDGANGTNGRLVTVNDGTRNVLHLAYGSNGLVSTVQNANDLDPTHASPNYNASHSLTVSYDSNSPNPQVASVSDGPVTNQTPSTSTWSFTYHPGTIQPTAPRASHYDYLVRNDAPLAYYPLDETSGTTAADASGNGNNASYSGGYTQNQSGALAGTNSGTAVGLSGGTISGSVPNLNTAPGAYNTVELWLKWDGAQGEIPFSLGGYTLFFNWNEFGFWNSGGDVYMTTNVPSANTWHYVVAEFYNGRPEDGAKLWIDGAQQTLAEVSGSTPSSSTVATNFNISGWSLNGNWRMQGGAIDAVALYGGLLSPAEIAAHYAEGKHNRTADGYTTLTPPNEQGQSCPANCISTYYDNLGHPTETDDTLGRTTESYYNVKNELLWSEDADGSPTDNLYGGPDGKPTGNPAVPDALLQTIGPDPDGSGPFARPVTSSRYDETAIGTAQARGPSLTGLRASYYENTALAGRATTIENDPNVDFSWASGPPALAADGVTHNFSVRWSGDLVVTSPGSYTFSTPTTYAGTRLVIDGTQAINNWASPFGATTSQPILLGAGLHSLALEYFDDTASTTPQVHLHWACTSCSPAIADTVIPTTSLLPGWFNKTSTVSPAGRLSFSHFANPATGDPDYNLVQVGGSNLITTYTYDTYGRILQQVMPKGNASRTIDSQGNLSGTPDTTYATTYAYYNPGITNAPPNAPDCSGPPVNQDEQLNTATVHGDATTTYVYDAAGNMIATTNGAGTTCSTYDNENRLTSTQAPGDALPTTYTYDPSGAQLTATGSTASYLGEFGHATSATSMPTHTVTLTGAPGPGSAVFLRVANTGGVAPGASAVTDSKGNTWTLLKQGTVGVANSLYATLQNVSPLAAGDVITVAYSPNVAGFAAIVDAFSGISSLTVDQSATASSSTNTTARNTGTTPATTQPSELQIASWGVNAKETSFTATAGASRFSTDFLTNNNATSTEGEYKFVNATGAYNLNASGGVSAKYNGFIVTLPAVATNTVTTYYDEQGRLVDTISKNGATTAAEARTTYDADSNPVCRIANTQALSSTTCPNATDYGTTYSYDPADQLSGETNQRDTSRGTYSFFYDNRGNLRGAQYPNGTFSWVDTNPVGEIADQYNRHGTISSTTTTPPADSTPLADYTYTYDQDGKRLSELRKSGSTSQTTTYTYDNLGRLTQVGLPNNTCRQYGYDLDSNRSQIQNYTTSNCTGTPATTSYTYNASTTPGVDELTSIGSTNYTYTSDGQTAKQGTTTYTWDGWGRLKTTTVGSNTVTYSYDPSGALKTRASSSPSSTLNYLLGDLFETNAAGTITTSYTDGPAGNLASYNGPPNSSSTPTYLYYDAHGNLAAEAGTSGSQTGNHTYDPFGTPTDSVPSNTTVHRFVGRWDKHTTPPAASSSWAPDPTTPPPAASSQSTPSPAAASTTTTTPAKTPSTTTT